MENPAICIECNKKFSNKSNLNKHVKKHLTHNFVAQEKTYNFTCKTCNKNFNHLRNLNYHKKVHKSMAITNENKLEISNKKAQKCPLCSRKDDTRRLRKHFTDDHGILMQSVNEDFANIEDFRKWKDQIETTTKSKYIKRSVANTERTVYYVCHRSGIYAPRGKHIRHLKTQGSNKIGAYCPASIKLMHHSNGTCQIEYVETHVGHTTELSHLTLKESERQMLANKIAMKIPFDSILDDVRDTVTDSKLSRLHLLTKRDLYNIETSFNLNSIAVKHTNDAISVDAWVMEMRNNNNSVLFYKAQGCKSNEHPELKDDDFVLIIMNSTQRELLKKYGNDCICIDGTLGINSYDFELTTLLVLDDMREGFPCAFLISNRSDTFIMSVFFYYIKSQVGLIKAKVFMSDMAESFYNAWLLVMAAAEFRLYCAWHVDQAWRKNLCKIKSKDKQVVVYKQLRTIMEETDMFAFQKMIQSFLNILSADTETDEFSKYFREKYLRKVESWAYCHRLRAGINTNMHIEWMHRTIKYIYLNGKNVKRLDKAIHAIMQFVKDKFFDRLITLHKGKLTSKIKNIRLRHKSCIDMETNLITAKNENCWNYPSSKSGEIYEIEEVFTNCECMLICPQCKVCIHRYSCTCIDSAIKWNMCKHVHMICGYLKAVNQNITPASQSDLTYNNETQQEISVILQEVNKEDTSELPFTPKKELCMKAFYQLMDEQLRTDSDIDVFQKHVSSIVPILEAARTNNRPAKFTPTRVVSTNKNIHPQRRFFSTKKSNNKPKANIIKRPSEAENINIAASLIL